MSKQTLVTVIIIGVLSAGGGWLVGSQTSPETPAPALPETGSSLVQEDTVERRYQDTVRSRYQDLEAKLNAAVAKVEKLRAENDRLAQELREREASAPRVVERSDVSVPSDVTVPPDVTVPEAPDPAGNGIDWERLSTTLANWVQVRDAVARDGRQLTQSEEAQRTEMFAALSRAAEKAHEISDHPIFDDEIFPDLAVTLFGSFLDLSEDQVTQIEERARQLVHDAAAALDPARALPVERAAVRQDLVGGLLEAAWESLEPDQQSEWPRVADEISSVLGGRQRRVETGIQDWDDGRLAESITGEWQRTFNVREDQSPSLREYALDYGRRSRDLLAEYGQTPDSSRPLTEDDQRAFERAMLDLQISIESQVVTLLDAEQVAALADAVPILLIFNYGSDGFISERAGPSF